MEKEVLDRAFDERFPLEIKKRLNSARVAIAGLGGLGSNIAIMLARSGVGNLLLVDYDVVDVTNLNRQAYMISHVGMPKTEAIKDILNQINPYLNYSFVNEKVTSENVAGIFNGYDIVCEAFDRADQKAMLVQELLVGLPDTVIVSGNGMSGYGDANDIRTSQKLKRLYVCGDGVSDVENGMGLMAPRVMACAAHQANKVIQIILQDEGEF